MKNFQWKSYVLGLVTGILLLLLIAGGMRLTAGSSTGTARTSSFQRQRGLQGGMNLSAIATKLGMTQADLESALKSGKTLRQLAEEHGVDISTLRRNAGSGSPLGGSGAALRYGSGSRLSSGSGSFRRNNAPSPSSSITQP